MNINTFKVAMANQLGLGSYEHPHVIARKASEWLIVTRSGQNGEQLTISDANGSVDENVQQAPDDLTPNNTIVGILIRENELQGSIFLLVRHLPLGAQVDGTFFPADGYAIVSQVDDILHLQASGRHAHSAGNNNGVDVLHDIPDPAPGNGIAWHFDATQIPWINEST